MWLMRFLYLQNMYQDQTDGDLEDIIVSMSDADKMSIFLPSIKELDEEDQGLDDYHKMLVKFINFETGKSLETIEGFGHIELLNELGGKLRKFNIKMNYRKILGFHRLKNISLLNTNSNSRQKPFPPGIFKGQEHFFSCFVFYAGYSALHITLQFSYFLNFTLGKGQ